MSLTIIILVSMHMLPAQEKLAQSGFQFLSISPDAREASLAGAITTVENGVGAIFSNPAMLSENQSAFSFMVSQNNWIADITHNAIAASYKPAGGRFGIFSANFFYVDYGEVEGTIIADNEQGYVETGIIKPSAYAVGLAYAKRLSNKFALGGQVKLVAQDLGSAIRSVNEESGDRTVDKNEESVLAFDFGTIYKTGLKSLNFGMSVRNFSEEIKYVSEGFQLPLTFNIGVSFNIMDFLPEQFQGQYLLISTDAVHPRSHPEYVRFGAEYRLMDMLSLRMGYLSNTDERSLTYGLGVKKFGFSFDYAYKPFGVFDNVQLFTVRFGI